MEDRKAVLLFSRSMSRQLHQRRQSPTPSYPQSLQIELLTPCDFAPRASLIARARSEQNTAALKPDSGLPKQSLPWLTILLDWSIACSATDKTTSNRASTNTNLNSSYSASNGSKKKPNHSTSNSFPLSNFHHQFLESTRMKWKSSRK